MSEEAGNISLELLKKQLERANQAQAHLKGGSGDGTSEEMSIVDAKIAAAEARTDAKFERVIGKLDLIEQTTRGTKTTVILTAIAAVGVAIGAMALGVTQFGNGVMVTSVAVQDATEAKRLSQENAVELKRLSDQMFNLVQALQKGPMQPQLMPAPNSQPQP